MINKSIEIKSHTKNYNVNFVDDFSFLNRIAPSSNILYVIDSNVYELYKKYFLNIDEDRLITIDAKEDNKTIEVALNICEKLTTIPAKRNATLISIGGGIIQDLTGFVANITYRGINWIFVPTTLLSACDSCIGGKTSLNYKKYKNLLGTFFPPNDIYIFSEFFRTLSDKDFKSGLGEVVKFNIMRGEDGLKSVENDLSFLLNRDNALIDTYVLSSLNYKKTYIEEDEFDKGERIKLNFAHTFGHAIEVISNYIIPHGTAVAIGMVMANHISNKRGLLSDEFTKKSEEQLLKIIDIEVCLLEKETNKYIDIIKKDKKQTNSNLTCVLLTNTQPITVPIIVNDLKENEVDDTIKYFVDLYRKEIVHEN